MKRGVCEKKGAKGGGNWRKKNGVGGGGDLGRIKKGKNSDHRPVRHVGNDQQWGGGEARTWGKLLHGWWQNEKHGNTQVSKTSARHGKKMEVMTKSSGVP